MREQGSELSLSLQFLSYIYPPPPPKRATLVLDAVTGGKALSKALGSDEKSGSLVKFKSVRMSDRNAGGGVDISQSTKKYYYKMRETYEI